MHNIQLLLLLLFFTKHLVYSECLFIYEILSQLPVYWTFTDWTPEKQNQKYILTAGIFKHQKFTICLFQAFEFKCSLLLSFPLHSKC